MFSYAKWIDRWEFDLATKDSNRVVRPFDWGAEWFLNPPPNGNAPQAMREFVERSVADSGNFFSAPTPEDFRLEGNHLTFTSAVRSPYPENNTVHGIYFPAPKHRGRAVVVLPQWNSDAGGHLGLCKLLNQFGLSALRMSMAYHDRRMPAELERADYHVSSNIGRTIHASRQSVIDVRACLTWLERQGYTKLAILGTSLGSCVAFITTAHDARVRCGVFNHVSMYFSDVVWTGLSTQHVRRGVEQQLTQDGLRRYWSVISPATYLDRLHGRDLKSLLVWAKYDTTFLPEYSLQVLEAFKKKRFPHEVFMLPCAHYTTGKFPFNWMDGLAMCGFLRRNL
ncbi:MAG: hypothetical protein IANPNBLG_02257 [Bryobacteraceae bacterium]|nr:hypothetical protein [Bryobacteraceae bacterium]